MTGVVRFLMIFGTSFSGFREALDLHGALGIGALIFEMNPYVTADADRAAAAPDKPGIEQEVVLAILILQDEVAGAGRGMSLDDRSRNEGRRAGPRRTASATTATRTT